MNFSAIFNNIGSLILVLGFSMFISMGWSIHHNENDIMAFVYSIALTLGVGLLLKIVTKPKGQIGIRESFLIVTLGWTLAGIFGALPFIFSGSVNTFIDGFFEAVSGFTTTGATIINDVENLSYGILFWRSFTQWLGGMGIIVLFIALLSKISSGSFQLFRAEVPGPTAERITPRITQTAKILWFIYVGISLLQTILLLSVGFTLFDALTHTFATVATGGFSTRNLSIGSFNNPSAEIIITIFMIIAGGNFSLYYFLLKGNWRKISDDKEFRFYIALILISTILIVFNISHLLPSVFDSIRKSLFQVVSIMTTTGFSTADFDTWPSFSKFILFILMFAGGCAGSTGGAIKQVRILVLFKYVFGEILKILHPKAVIALKVGDKIILDDVTKNILAFTFIYLFIFVIGSLLMTLLGLDLESAVSSVAATLGNIGPGFATVGPFHTYSEIPSIGKLVLSVLMLLGRLELFTVIICFIPEFWKTTKLPSIK